MAQRMNLQDISDGLLLMADTTCFDDWEYIEAARAVIHELQNPTDVEKEMAAARHRLSSRND